MKFYLCEHCKNVITFIKDSGIPVKCCGEDMEEIIPNITDAATEKHLPVVSVKCGRVSVTVGETVHPMSAEHQIDWVCIESDSGFQIKHFASSDTPTASFALPKGDSLKAVYAYCNLHGLWKV